MHATVEQPSLGEALQAALLAGEGIVAGRFAHTTGFTRQGIASALRTLEKRGLVVGERVERGGTPLVVYTCSDKAALLARQVATQKFNPMTELVPAAPDFSALLRAWGIKRADIALPAVRHLIMNMGAEV